MSQREAGVASTTTEEPPSTLGRALRQVGPGLILAAAIVGTGELIATTNLGAKAGFVVLWLVLLSCFTKVFVQVELGRNAIGTGRSTFEAFAGMGAAGKLLVVWCAVMVLVTQLQIGAMIGGVGQAMHMILPGFSDRVAAGIGVPDRPELPWGVLVTVATAAILFYGGYRLIESFMMLLVVGFTFMTVGCVVFLPPGSSISLGDLASGFGFRIPAPVVNDALAMFGITGVGAVELLTYPYWCVEKGYARKTGLPEAGEAWGRRAAGWLRVMRLDAWVSMGVYLLATVAFYLLGAAVLHERTEGEGLPRSVGEMLETLGRMYEPVFGATGARWFLVVGAFAVLYSTLFAATAGTSRLLADSLGVLGLFRREDARARAGWVRFFCVVLPLIGLVLFIAVGNPVRMVQYGGIAQASTLPLIGMAALYLRYRRTDRRLRPSTLWDVFLWLSMLGLTFGGLFLVWNSEPVGALWDRLGL